MLVEVVVDAGPVVLVEPGLPPPGLPPPGLPEPDPPQSLGLVTQSAPPSNTLLMLSPRTKIPLTSTNAMMATISA